MLEGFYTAKKYPMKIRRIKFHDQDNNRTLIFLANNLNIDAEVALSYKNRWQVELQIYKTASKDKIILGLF